MPVLATPLLILALGAAEPLAHNPDWIAASLDASCDVTDIDFSDRLHGFATCVFGTAMTTDDGGLSWAVFDTGLAQSLVFAHAASADEIYAARLGFFHSTDRGQHWEALGGLNDASTVFDVHFGDAGHLVAIQGGTIFTSDDAGAHWDPRWPSVQDIYFDELHFPSAAVGYATGGHGSVLRTIDGGVNWDLLSFAHGDIGAADFFDEDHGVVATALGELYATADAGGSWQLIGPSPDAALLMDIAHRDAAHWYAVSLQGCLYETRNAGVRWETDYCDASANALVSITLRGGPAVVGGNGSVVLWENRILKDGFD